MKNEVRFSSYLARPLLGRAFLKWTQGALVLCSQLIVHTLHLTSHPYTTTKTFSLV